MTVTTDIKLIDDLLSRYVQAAYPSAERAREFFTSGRQLSFYLGIDPTGPDIHLGHATNLLWLKKLSQLGHRVILVIGDFTARIGDPTDKDAARRALTEEEIQENMKTYLEQVHRILPEDSCTVRHNSEWLNAMNFADLIRLAGNFTVQQMLVRDMFQERLKKEKPIYLHEFLYPLAQGYDSVALDIDGEVGGNDQTFNMLVGRDLMRILSKKEKLVIATKLLEDPVTGKKVMNKSEGNVISLNDAPQEIRRKVLNLDDRLTRTIFELSTEKDLAWIAEHAEGDPRRFKEELAEELVRMLYGQETVAQAREPRQVSLAGDRDIVSVLIEIGAATSSSSAKRLLEQGGVNVNGQPMKEWSYEVKPGDEIQIGPGKFIKIGS